jgi:serine/threonine protein kinase
MDRARKLWDTILAQDHEVASNPNATLSAPPPPMIGKRTVLQKMDVESAETVFSLDESARYSSKPAPAKGSQNGAHFELEKEIARGGMGIVFHGRQNSLERDVAIKQSLATSNDRSRERFLIEARVTAYLQHPNIVPVHDLGENDQGHCLMVMKLLGGSTWESLLHPEDGGSPPDWDSSIDVLLKVSDAIAYAHSRDIVHCDLKPDNVMVGEFGEVVVMDWGIAVDIRPGDVDDARGLRREHIKSPMGTPTYMAPELALGDGAAIGKRTDVYLLGAILYEILTGDPPHNGDNLMAMVKHAVSGEVPSFPKGVPKHLRAICEKALSPDPKNRYAEVSEFSEALRSYLKVRETRRFLLICFGFVSVLAVLGLLGSLLLANEVDLNEAQDVRFQSYAVAMDLEKSSDDLTSAARTYVMTADPMYRDRYFEILEVRNGKAPRPDGRRISQDDLMRELGFSDEEFSLLNASEEQSNELVKTEEIAMHAVLGLFQDPEGRFTRRAEPNLTMAQSLMFSERYREAKARIQAPIDAFVVALDQRTSQTVRAHMQLSKVLLGSMMVLLLLLAMVTIFITYRLYRNVQMQNGQAGGGTRGLAPVTLS